ncbi:NADH-quinone oxidoreductase subunit NuoH [Colwellia hornerae]|uniref:NADH-quinone oxidoreductase subunit H n=1 Tax=Colwellia hornerae TaxID=89402 RepID=A0A5C6QPA5_9GAMM|nr:NADH-quinone oxidoreductase subunit NuoH [Colwellia hornerae]TWX56278.1 NADH-quinone oxidoreductase subunit NuoH [Colwellia hornerae]TWX62129.1 NADH-quinone oxidoreductase subunit NuoH [Colwellia hornerae]TWX70531.1 NADH-quinone oxidoreductase subunit NuoH [Colwellia hornerae]
MTPEIMWKLLEIILIISLLIPIAATLVWVERRMIGIWQDRHGPNRVGPFGILQSLADLLKILGKEDWIPPFSDRLVFVLAPVIGAVCVLMSFAVIPFTADIGVSDLNIGLLFFLAMASLAVYSVVLAGWASNSKYALLGGMRAAAQTVSYEVFMGLSVMGVVLLTGTFNLRDIVLAQTDGWLIQSQFVGFSVFLIAGIAESHRLPFDLPEAETELTGGFHTEYSGLKFALFFLGEYLSVTLISAMSVVLFFGGWLMPAPLDTWLPPLVWFILKVLFFVFFFILLRTSLPRPRFDQLLAFGWQVMLPIALLNLLVTAALRLGGVL